MIPTFRGIVPSDLRTSDESRFLPSPRDRPIPLLPQTHLPQGRQADAGSYTSPVHRDRSEMAFRFGSHESEDSPDNRADRRNQRRFDEDDGRASKRQRTALACNSCRYRKSRCNGVHPTCSTCSDLGLECVYRGPAPTPRFQSRDLQSMERRLQKFEDLLLGIVTNQQMSGNSNNNNITTPAMSRYPSQPQGGSYVEAPPLQNTSVPAFPNLVRFQPEQATAQRDQPMSKLWPMAQEDTVDGMGSIIFADDSSSGFFGPSSNSAFFSKIAKVLALGIRTMPEGRDSTRDLAGALSRPASPAAQSRGSARPVNPYKLPSRAEISRITDIFFSHTGQFFPYISKTSLTEMVEELESTNFSNVRKSGLCLLNAVLAMGTSLDRGVGRHPKSIEIEADVFFQRALALSPWTISNTANLETLQALTAMTQYLQGTSRSAQTWKLHGLLVQAAFQLGVYTQDPNAKISALEREIRTRIWYTCIILDRVFSTTFGRPLLINNELIHIDLPLDIELDQLPKDQSQFEMPQNPESRPSPGVIFIPSIKLYRLQGDIICDIYNHNVISSHTVRSDELYSKIIQVDHALEKWKADLPPISALLPLEFVDNMDTESWAYTKAQTTLTLRYLNVRALLFRKILERSLDHFAKSSTSAVPPSGSLPIGQIMIQACADACVQTIAIIRTTVSKPQVLPAWWYTVYYVFNSALILFGVICLQTLGKTNFGTKPAAELVAVIQSGLEALEIIGKERRIVRRCSKYLTKIILVSTLLVRNHASVQQLPAGVTALINSLPNGNPPPSTSGGNTPSPLQTDFGQFLIDEDYAFLDVWTDLVQDTSTAFPNA
ncbi:uncharacterized protein PV07_03133 [Cladophialophora immunda]|uniref:Zn(2)-C6 fungal-type domain-containing protein n=1 Tax=Cladophialophora immunda TaxID=569365 RepID=A0A0D2D731_9EURO|nr:uncharacterized protein PV07_03133 [Cladophialophora immunda]KIW31489.1 hypothetical protein PV07_03133 [Cladophialophora immunda]